ncbi:MAG: response regulator [Methanoregula sp.]|nr:response regulator [Methanoregula sp.]
MMGGEINVESEPGKGSTFNFTVRLKRKADDVFHKYIPDGTLRDMKILLVDDNVTNLSILKHQTEGWGMRCEIASSSQQALEMLQASSESDPFRIAILDMHMPDMDGIELARCIKQKSSPPEIHLIMLTSIGYLGDAEQARNAGIEVYLSKPVRLSKLYNSLQSVIGNTLELPLPEKEIGSYSRVTYHARILLVEDNPVNQELGLAMLTNFGCEVDIASNGIEAVKAFSNAKTPYNLVFMDCQMPEMDGFEATKAIREKESREGGHIIVVALTAHAMEGDREYCLNAGMDDYLSKPFNMKKLHSVLERWIPSGLDAEYPKKTAEGWIQNVEPGTPQKDSPPDPDSSALIQDTDRKSSIDPEVLDEIRILDVEGKSGILHKVIAIFLENTPGLLNTIREGIDTGNSDTIRHAAHTLKSSSAMLGAMTLSRFSKEMEMEGKNNSLENAMGLMSQMESEFEIVQAALRSEIQNSRES